MISYLFQGLHHRTHIDFQEVRMQCFKELEKTASAANKLLVVYAS